MDTVCKALDDPDRCAILEARRGRDRQTLTEIEVQLDLTGKTSAHPTGATRKFLEEGICKILCEGFCAALG
ncbi:hypothetical protein DLJ49_09780 [Rhodovulum sp. 12E13]|uniref:helix-turn-helix transcriptional regulator n=1 Tax=Rhodovulum sp. 12E13 TaxID=2203891 RepID=UPI000E1A58EE|nr:helix-turn-helix transcriptional regulator [Rhodovulum sp. 12E13]RDC72509.1 hypothetical protein DLJ49_09780 [Rhodovulum sp. 12E13]